MKVPDVLTDRNKLLKRRVPKFCLLSPEQQADRIKELAIKLWSSGGVKVYHKTDRLLNEVKKVSSER